MINGAHVIIYSTDAEADKAFFAEVLGFHHVDVGHGWLIFALPPAEMAVHPSDENDKHALYLMTDDVDAEVRRLNSQGIPCEPIDNVGWGRRTSLRLPGGGRVGLYEPRHERP